MKIEKLHLSEQKKDINFQFYVLLKCLTKLKASNVQEIMMIENVSLLKNNPISLSESLKKIFIKSHEKSEYIKEICERLLKTDDVELFDFSLKLH